MNSNLLLALALAVILVLSVTPGAQARRRSGRDLDMAGPAHRDEY